MPLYTKDEGIWKTVFLDAVIEDSSLWSWGYNGYGQLGHNEIIGKSFPVQVELNPATIPIIYKIVGGGYPGHSFMLCQYEDLGLHNSLFGWGYNNNGELGKNDRINRSYPTLVEMNDVVDVSAGHSFTFFLKSNGLLYSFGFNDEGQLGHNDRINRSVPTQIGTATDWKEILCGSSSNLALKNDGTLWTWGNNYYGILGHGDTISKSVPTQVGSQTDWKIISISEERWGYGVHSLAIKTNGTLWSWGNNDHGQLGHNDRIRRSVPIQIGSQTDWKYITAGYYNSYALKTNGTLWSWGYNNYGSLGHSDAIHRSVPTQVGTAADWKHICTNKLSHTISGDSNGIYGIKNNGTLWSCGQNNFGQLGHNDRISRSVLTQIGTGINWKDIAGGYQFVLATKRTK
jgi:alpha-tubulin suppressor-like RCC1 family protein